jgi:hypothetical protein
MRTVAWFVIFGGLLGVAACAKGGTDPRGEDEARFNEGDSDETDETEGGNCTESQFECGTGDCIAKMYACDGTAQCSDESDEYPSNTDCPDNSCVAGQWACADSSCISQVAFCDGYLDCVDGSDETTANCGACGGGYWQCADGGCVYSSYVCDGYLDCTDGSDESAC